MAVSIADVVGGVTIRPPKIVLYGVGGVGKTTFASRAPNPIFIFAEEGQGTLDVQRFKFGQEEVIHSWEDLLDAVGALYHQEHDYQTLVIDSLDAAESFLWAYTAKKHNKTDIESFDYNKGYYYAAEFTSVLLQGLDALRRVRNMSIVIICHSQIVRFEAPDAPSYDRYDLRLQKRLTPVIDHWADAVLFANYRHSIVSEDETFGRERMRAVGYGERVLYCEARPAFRAKNRYGLPPELPLEWSAFQSSIVTTGKPNTEQLESTQQPEKTDKEQERAKI